MNESRAARLAATAGRRRADGSRGPLARRAWRRLVTAGDRGAQVAVSVVWQEWLRAPDEEPWEVLSRWRGPQRLAEEAFEAAVDPACPAGQRAAIGEFCTQHGLVPQDAVRRAMFFVLTGQLTQHQAADPDGRLVAAGYRFSGEPARAALRSALASSGDLDVVRVVVGGGQADRATELTAQERGYLTGHLAARRDWAGLWRLARDLALADAVAAVRLFCDGWEPADDRDRALFGLLSRAGPADIATSRDALAKPAVIQVKPRQSAKRGSFSPDGRRLLLFTAYFGLTADEGLEVYELPSGSLVEKHDYHPKLWPDVLHLGSSFLVVQPAEPGWEVVRYAGGQPQVLRSSAQPMTVAAHPAGFVLLEELRPEPRFRVTLYDVSCAVLSDSQVDLWDRSLAPTRLYRVTADPVSGRLVVSGNGMFVLAEDGSAVLAAMPPPPVIDAACFTSPGTVAARNYTTRQVCSYQVIGDALKLQASVPDVDLLGANLYTMRQRDEIAVHIGHIRYLDAQTLAEKSHPDEFGGSYTTEFWVSADGRSQALCISDSGPPIVRVIWGAGACQLADQPMGRMKPADLATAVTATHGAAPATAAWPFLDLLRECLELRFASDVGLAEPGQAAGSADDVGLAG
jgi:hypothetical protein